MLLFITYYFILFDCVDSIFYLHIVHLYQIYLPKRKLSMYLKIYQMLKQRSMLKKVNKISSVLQKQLRNVQMKLRKLFIANVC
uniref:SJCHGC09776 protein n=1 Tax=Schistosoma japonicum TaxID=6182 RepID=Q5BQX1_SCHJA|nr:SJCHGC09776 protein [Schistosoma japonicum]